MSETERIVFESAKFGTVSVDPASVVTFPRGLPGFEGLRRFGLVEVEEEAPFARLLSLEEPRVGFVILDPLLVWADYAPPIGDEDLRGLGIEREEQLALYCVVTLNPEPTRVTANLKGPICINAQTMQARQLILVDDRYHTKHPLMGEGRQAP